MDLFILHQIRLIINCPKTQKHEYMAIESLTMGTVDASTELRIFDSNQIDGEKSVGRRFDGTSEKIIIFWLVSDEIWVRDFVNTCLYSDDYPYDAGFGCWNTS